MNLSLQLQTDNVHVSLKKTIPDAPFILKQDLTRLVEEIEQQPNALQPYIRFMRVPDSGCAFCNEDLVFHGRIWN